MTPEPIQPILLEDENEEDEDYEPYDAEIDGTFCNFCGNELDPEGYCPNWESEIRPDLPEAMDEDAEYDPNLHGTFCNYCGGPYLPDGTCPACEAPEPKKASASTGLFSYGSWKVHAIIIVIYVAITTPITWWICLTSPALYALIAALTNTSNLVALGYSVYIYYLVDTSKREAIKKAQEKGIDVPNLDEALGMIYSKFKQFDDWFEANKHQLKKLERKISKIDLSDMVDSIEELTKISDSIKESGLTSADMAEFFRVMPKAMERLKKFIDEEEMKLSDIPDSCLTNPPKK
ncbi:hypothetical protein [Sulfuricurvum sp.]|uniref:hypothetical protein n=1 Tax=Sulfuricurvum sp. TaxID=2025608 RepID=UPI0035627951